MISAIAGDDDSLEKIRKCYMNGWATKDDFEKALRAHKEAKDGMRSDQRDAAAAFYVRQKAKYMSDFYRQSGATLLSAHPWLSELVVLESVDFDRVEFGIIVVEAGGICSSRRVTPYYLNMSGVTCSRMTISTKSM